MTQQKTQFVLPEHTNTLLLKKILTSRQPILNQLTRKDRYFGWSLRIQHAHIWRENNRLTSLRTPY